MSLPAAQHSLTEAEYLATDRAAPFKSEFFNGEMFAIAGGTPQHSLIATNVAAQFRLPCTAELAFLTTPICESKCEATGLLTYPDLSIIRGPLEFAEDTGDTVVNPTLLVEVLSESTEAYDRGKKFEHYRQIPSVRDFLLVSQKEARLELFSGQVGGRWVLTEASGLSSTMEIPSLRIVIPLSEVFADVQFASGPIRSSVPAR